MKKLLNLRTYLAVFLAAAPLAATAQTIFFTDNFTSGSTTNGTSISGGTPTASFTSYDIASSKNATASTIVPGDFTLKLNAATTSGYMETQALFATNAVALSTVGDFIDIAVVFTNTPQTNSTSPTVPVSSILAGGTKSLVWIGLYNSGGSAPVAGSLVNAGLNTTAGSAFATGNCANWQGYVAQVSSGGTTRLTTRPIQNGAGTTSANQELFGSGVSGGTFNNPTAATIATAPVTTVNLNSGGQYTLELRLILTDVNTLTISNYIFSGAGTGGPLIFSQGSTNISGATFLTGAFDGLAIGAFNSGTSIDPTMDITSIQVTGQSTVVTTPPTITSQPKPISVVTNGAGAFTVAATGFGVTYQWHLNGTNLLDGGHISGSTTAQLVISPATTADVFSGANGYYVTVSGTGGFSTNSITNSLALIPATNLVWSGNAGAWDLNTTADWLDTNGNPMVFNYGDPVTFNDIGAGGLTAVTLTGNFLSAASVTVDSTSKYIFQGSGSFAGPGSLIYKNSGQLDIKNANAYNGGTIISNSAADLVLENYNGVGTGPVTLAKAGGIMEIVPSGSAAIGINGNIIVADDFTITFDASGTFAGVFFGDLSGTVGKTLSLEPTFGSPFTNSRVRIYGINTVYNGNLFIDGPPTSEAQYNGFVIAAYGPSGSQTYNGIISGNGGFIARANGTTIFNGANTYSGGTTPSTGIIGFGIDSSPAVGTVISGPIGTGPLNIAPEVNSANGSGTVFASLGARTIANLIQYPSGTNNQTLVIGGTNNLTFSGSYTLNGVDGLGSPTNRTIQVTNTGLTTISGVISDGGAGYGFVKTGSGTLALNNTETYSGPTVASNGTLQVNGQLAAASTVTVISNATLSGIGSINGAVTVNGILAPGTASIGTLHINNNLTLAGNALFKVNKSVLPSNDLAVVSGALINTSTGTLTVTNLGLAFVVGDSFKLFSAAVVNGNALTVTGGGVIWTNKLAVDGSVAILSTIANNPTNITVSVSGNVLTLSWPADHTGWSLQVQTNSLANGLGTNWVVVPGSSAVNSTNFVINPVNGAVFYRLISP